jgi:hypothetical protein
VVSLPARRVETNWSLMTFLSCVNSLRLCVNVFFSVSSSVRSLFAEVDDIRMARSTKGAMKLLRVSIESTKSLGL